MATVTEKDILFRSGGACLTKYGVPWYRRRWDKDEGEAYTFTRADASTCATYVDQGLLIRNAVAGKLRADWSGSTLGLLLEAARTNLCLQSEDFATTWTAIGTPTITTNAATCGTLSLDLIGDDSAAAGEGYYQSFATGVVATGAAALSFFVKVGTSVPATYGEIALTDTTAGVKRARCNVTWTGTVAVATCTTGTVLATVALGGGVYRVLIQSTTCLAANGHNIDIYPASGIIADVGNLYVGGVQLENAPYPSSYIKTTAATITRAADALTFPIGFPPQDLTVYVRLPRPAWADATGAFTFTLGVVGIGSDASFGALLYGSETSRLWGAWLGEQTVTASIPAGSTQELCAQFRFTTDGKCRLDVGSGFGALSSVATNLTFANQNSQVGHWQNANQSLDGAIEQLLVCRGLFTLAEMQAWAAL